MHVRVSTRRTTVKSVANIVELNQKPKPVICSHRIINHHKVEKNVRLIDIYRSNGALKSGGLTPCSFFPEVLQRTKLSRPGLYAFSVIF